MAQTSSLKFCIFGVKIGVIPPRGGHLWGLEGQLLLILDVGRVAHHTNQKKKWVTFFLPENG